MDGNIKTLIRSRSPLRLGLAGGGTDVSPYSDMFGGCVLNVTIDLFAHCTLELTDNDSIEFVAQDVGLAYRGKLAAQLELDGELSLHKAIYNRVVRDFNGGRPIGLKITTRADAPPGSGLGTSSTMVVAMLAAYRELLALPLGEYDLAHLAYEIERIDCGLAGGKQDQYATTFGGFNFMEFFDNNRVVVNPLRIRRHIENELQAQMLMYFTGQSRQSALIINDQIQSAHSTETGSSRALQAMHDMKSLSFKMKEVLLKGNIRAMADLLRDSWQAKKQTANAISNNAIESIADAAMQAGASAVKISGAGGGGFMMLFVDPVRQLAVIKALQEFDGSFHKFQFTHNGAEAWRVG